MDIGTLLQVLTLAVAAIGPVLAYRYARKLSLSGNRQAWLDALREDVALFVALKDSRITLMRELRDHSNEDQDGRRSLKSAIVEKGVDLQAARHRIRLRLRTGNVKHDRLAAAVDSFAQAKFQNNRTTNRAEIISAAEAVIQHTWAKIEKGE